MDILKGNINVHELTLNSPVITLVQEPDGSSNLDPITSGGDSPESSEPTRLSLRNFSLKNAIVRQVQKSGDGSLSTTELANLNLEVDRLGNGQTGNLKLSSFPSKSLHR